MTAVFCYLVGHQCPFVDVCLSNCKMLADTSLAGGCSGNIVDPWKLLRFVSSCSSSLGYHHDHELSR